MSNKSQELKYVEKLNINTLGIAATKNLIKNYISQWFAAKEKGITFKKNTFRIISPAGVGKTSIMRQIAKELSVELEKKFELLMITAPVLSRDDFIIPFPDGNRFKMLYSDFVPQDPKSCGIFVIDENSRGDHALQQLLWQAQNENSIHLHKFPEGWFVVSLDNPDDSEYSMDMLEDAAGLRRVIHSYVEVNPVDFLNHAREMKFHDTVVSYIETKPEKLYDFDSQKKGMVYANPASWEKLSDHLTLFDMNGGWRTHMTEVETIASGLINVSHTRLFIEFANSQKEITPKDIFNSYNKIKKDVVGYVKNNNNTKLAELVQSFVVYMVTAKPEYNENQLNNIAEFLSDISVDTAAIFITDIDNLQRSSEEYKYMTKLHMNAMKIEKYKRDFYERLANISETKK